MQSFWTRITHVIMLKAMNIVLKNHWGPVTWIYNSNHSNDTRIFVLYNIYTWARAPHLLLLLSLRASVWHDTHAELLCVTGNFEYFFVCSWSIEWTLILIFHTNANFNWNHSIWIGFIAICYSLPLLFLYFIVLLFILSQKFSINCVISLCQSHGECNICFSLKL